ncbi:MAG: carboxypeptidase-like regulatory domain-containing protein [Bacteroidetes bacterium]|nr:carboxypeptidase-like regulatory domain-containing protein [Bacteroidota bacterium]
MIRAFRICLLLLLFSQFAWSQSATVRGFVYDKDNGEPLIFINVFLEGTTIGAVTDVNGYYTVTNIPTGTYVLMATYLGYDTAKVEITLKKNQIITRKLFIGESAIELRIVDINAERQESRTEIKISTTKITPREIKKIPSVGGEADLAQYLQVLPGIVFTGEQGGQLYVRGGSPIQNKILLDGMIIYSPFHSIGLFSVFETDIIRNVDVYTGGFNAEHGGRISAIIDITTKDGNKKRMAGKFATNPFLSKFLLEGPIRKLTKDGASSSYIITAKQSYLDQSSKVIYPYIDSAGLPFSFTDLYGKLSLHADNGSKVNFFGFSFNDHVNFEGVSKLDWNSRGFGTNYVLIPPGSSVLMQGIFAFSNYLVTLQEADGKPRLSSINSFDLGMSFTYYKQDQELKYGIDVLGYRTDFQFFNQLGIKIEQQQNTTELAGYLKYRRIIDKLIIEPSLRLHYYASLENFSPEPRIGLKYNATEKMRLKFAGGLYSQNLISATSDRDVVNLFVGFLSGPDFDLEDINGEITFHKLQKSIHAIGGVEYDLGKHFDLNFEFYYKYYPQLINLNRNKLFFTDPDFAIETGVAKGADLLLKYDHKQVYFWFTYSLGYVTRNDGNIIYPPHYDRRHNMNLVTSYIFGDAKTWEISARWNFGSGFPFTQTQAFYELIDFTDGINTDLTNTNGQLGIIYGQLNNGRLPHYHRLDISLKKTVAITMNSELEITAGVTNAYNRENIFYFDRIEYERVNQLPILPSLGLNLTF